MGNVVKKKAYAKVNLSLDIVGRREDGYHLVRMVMQSLDIADELTFEKTENGKIEVLLNSQQNEGSEVSASETTDKLGVVPLNEDNLIYKVAKLLLEKYVWEKNPEAGVKITLIKNIPIAAGLAGGSSDAAATFRGINELYELNILDQDLMDMGVNLGADIPYCIMGGTALSEGIGEKLTQLPSLPKCYFLVAKPNISVSTAEAYGGYDKLVESEEKIKHPDVDGQVDAIYSENLKGVTDLFKNVLEYVTSRNHEEIGILEKEMMDGGAINAMMSGSGPTVFGVFEDADTAENTKQKIEEKGLAKQVFVARAV